MKRQISLDHAVRVAGGAADLRRRAEQCARLADGAVPPDVADELRLIAEEYEAHAARLEAGVQRNGRRAAAVRV
jgi:hypothetical protein